MNDNVRAALIAFISSLFPVLNLTGILDLTSDEISLIMLAVSNGVTLAALILKKGQLAGPAVIAGLALTLGLVAYQPGVVSAQEAPAETPIPTATAAPTATPSPSPSPTPTSTPAPTGELHILVDSDSTQRFRFTAAGGLDAFSLWSDEVQNFGQLVDGLYRVTLRQVTDAWELTDITCSTPRRSDVQTSVDERAVTVDLRRGETIGCTFVVSLKATPTVTSTPEPTPTGTPEPTAVPTQAPVFIPVPIVQTVVVEPTPVPTVAPVVIRPPSTGDAGLR